MDEFSKITAKAVEYYEKLHEVEKEIGMERLLQLVEADREGRCAILPCKVGSVVHVNGKPEKQEIVDCITIYDGGKMTYGFHEFGVSEVFVDEWNEGEVENYVVVGV